MEYTLSIFLIYFFWQYPGSRTFPKARSKACPPLLDPIRKRILDTKVTSEFGDDSDPITRFVMIERLRPPMLFDGIFKRVYRGDVRAERIFYCKTITLKIYLKYTF